jgi:signal transduction histidine kinase
VASVVVAAGLVALGVLVALWASDILLPLVALVGAVAASAAGREAVESREVQRETAAVLASLIEQRLGGEPESLPRGVGGRLRLSRRLQRQIVRDRDLRRALLDGLREGVVLWDRSGNTLLANETVSSLWGTTPSRTEVMTLIGGSEGWEGEGTRGDTIRNGRHLELEAHEIEAGTLGLIRDVSAQRELERHRSEMQRMVSHELKTPLASISGFGAMIERYELDRAEQLRVAGRIRGEADRLGTMVSTFLDLERLGAGRWQAERSVIDLGALATERCRFLDSSASAAAVKLEVSASEDCMILGSVELVTRLLDNLVGNAIKYSDPPGAIEVRVTSPADGVELAVRDRGPGIPEEALPHLFERFYRVAGGERSGTGLGLALVRQIVDWHGAAIVVETELGRGSTFRVSFPASGREEGR